MVNKLILEQIERDKKWLEFAQNQGKNDREYFQHLFNLTYWFIAAIVAVVGPRRNSAGRSLNPADS